MGDNEKKQDIPVVNDYRKETARRKKKFKHKRQNPLLALYEDNRQYWILFAVIATVLAVILISILGLDISAVSVCIIIVLEAALAVCLQDVPIWLHGLAVAAQMTAGALCGKFIFMLLCSAVYVVSILALKFFRN